MYDYDPDIPPTREMVLARVHPDDLWIIEDAFARIVQGGASFDFQHRLLMPDSSIKYLHTRAHPVTDDRGHEEILGALTDITEQVKAKAFIEDALAKLQKSEDHLRRIIDTIPTLAWSTQADGEAEFFSKRWLDYTGLSKEEAQGQGWTVTLHPDDSKTFLNRWIEIIASKNPGETEARLRRFDGEYRWFLFRAAPLTDQQGTPEKWYGTNTDIEDRKRAEEALRRSKAYLEHAQQLSHTGSVGFRLSDGQIFWSEESARIYGYDPAIPPTMEMVLARVHPDDVAHLKEVFRQAAAGGASFDFEHRLLMPDGSIKYISNYSHSVKDAAGNEEVMGAITDITERKLAEDKLRRSEAFLADGQRISHTGSWDLNISSGELVWSEESYRIFGYNPNEVELSFELFKKRVHPDDLVVIQQTLDGAIAEGREFSTEFRIILPDGSVKHIQCRGRPAKSGLGSAKVYIGTNLDITVTRRAEEALRQAQVELAHVTRVTTMGELAASIVHEVSQPIAGVVINANSCLRWLAKVKNDSGNLAEARDAVQRIIRDGMRARDVIARIRTLFKKAETVREPLDLNEAIHEVIVMIRSEIGKRSVTLRLELGHELPSVIGDRVQLQQVMLNLILNAIEAMSAVEGRLRELVIGTQIHKQREVLVTVRDTGHGLDPSCAEQIFAAFHTTKPGGLGMGLSISRSIVENHSGRLWATSNDCAGATFHFTLSAHGASAKEATGS